MTEQRKLVKKLSEVMQEVKYIEKKGFNAFHKYKYATESDVAEKIREVLAEKIVMMIPNMTNHNVREHVNAKGKTEYIVTVDMEFTFYDGETGETIVFNMAGEGQDAGDKAVYKAITGAQKYALMKVFMIPTGDDPEGDSSVDERNVNNNNTSGNTNLASDKQLNLVKNLLNKKVTDKYDFTSLYTSLKERMNTTADMENWTSSQASQAIKILQG
ncbi:ERF family protein [Niallia sp. RD1]|uniref:ERF family protein n=1 Tax=Niallia sp. RD1 TaxID=2962858 RepID=UPI0020C1B4F0|nr:ERF family protein [Niallia sp. RD1]UTI41074.1 ERF family protein [Niallia sp. RD1]